MISSLNFALFPSNELFTFSKNVIALADAKKGQIPAIDVFLTNVVTKSTGFQSALERESKNPLIQEQSDRDKERIDAFVSFRTFCESASTRRKAGVPEAAEIIIATIRKHAWTIQSMGQKARTAAISSIISEITTKHAAELSIIGGGELLDELILAEQEYELVFQRVKESIATSNEPTVGETRPELVAALKALFQIIGLQEIAAPSGDVTILTNTLNELISKSLSTIKANDTRAENAKKAEAKKAEEKKNSLNASKGGLKDAV